MTWIIDEGLNLLSNLWFLFLITGVSFIIITVNEKRKKDFKFAALISKFWLVILVVGAAFVIVMVNFNFQDKFFREEMIAHTAMRTGYKNVCTCETCGLKGLAYCMHCGSPMDWDNTAGLFVCSNCKNTGLPQCPMCKTPMIGHSHGTANNNVDTGTNGSPIPIY
jgi:hypothetical protein